ncbi:unnamed protein product [Chrysoparadoxa australica]
MASLTFEAAFEHFHLSLAEKDYDNMVNMIATMETILGSAPTELAGVYGEMLSDCKRKGSEVILDHLRHLCKEGRTASMQIDSELLGCLTKACHCASSIGQGRSAANIYGGLQRSRLKAASDNAMKKLSGVRAMHRLNLASGGSNVTGSSEPDAHPHVTALSVVTGEGGARISELFQAGLGEEFWSAANGLHEDCSAAALDILQWFHHDSNLVKWQEAAATTVQSPPPSSSGSNPSQREEKAAIDVQGMDFVIDELAFLCQFTQRYSDFCVEDVGLGSSEELTSFMQQLVGVYVQLEDAYCLTSVGEAMRIAEPIEVADGVKVSSMVEDASFLIQKSLERSISTCSEHAIMAMCNRITEILEPGAPLPSFYGGLQLVVDVDDKPDSASRPEEAKDFSSAANALAAALEEAADANEGELAGPGLEEMLVLINSAAVAVGSVQSVEKQLIHHLETDSPLVQTMLEQTHQVVEAYEELRNHHIEVLLDRYYPPIQRELLAGYRAAPGGYILSPESYERLSHEMPAISGACKAIEDWQLGSRCKSGMVSVAFEVMVQKLAERLAKDTEQLVRELSGGFNEWGAMVLQAEVRALQRRLGALLDGGTLMKQFASLNKMVLVLNLERPEDVRHYETCNDGSISKEEIEAIMSLRTDFDAAAIKAAC